MRNSSSSLLVAVALLFLSAACTTTKSSAPVVDRAQGQSRTSDASRQRPPAQAAAASQPAQAAPSQRAAYYTVKRGDTLLRIAQEFSQNWRDLVTWNKLASANDIKVDQVLRVLPPDAPVAAGAQTGAVAVNSGVEVRPLGQGPAATAATPSKSLPRGDKRAYSDATLAEMQKPDGAPVAAASRPEAAKPGARPAEQAATADDAPELIWPTEGRVVSVFDQAKKGIDIAGTLGQPVLAAGSGAVLYAGSMRGYGNLVIVKHTNTYLSAYAHNKTILVKEGQTVSRGQKIAEMGNSDTDRVKLHFEIRQQGKPVDPTKYLPNR
ncbi:peptidoglycan DD-metalloendopeptidase family protein [Lacisediminimonas sp.]|uniref:peptidoglycan DD-metalloendopeptidase family protein n=1 Tax=Lacisediminimonas sp. TaxID=3060582 RepID=UPI002721200A|nr:peptidoglycan DD-metalloendopeptidase family protein [Lacisediminimonas sp.]MDO8301279.1 peptidoglycan DD-metalloendopeptidase family protein [Lacisediminimonas sp.]